MSTQLLIYETAIPVSSVRHARCYVEAGNTYAFTRSINSVPLMTVEFTQAEPEYTIVFSGADENIMPAVILGARHNENLYLTQDGGWQAKYIPAFVRRYPFVFSKSEDGETFTLCVDEAFPGVNFQGRGRPLFNEEGKPSEYTENVLKFLQEFRVQFQNTQAFCKKLRENGLLEPMKAVFTLGSGEKMTLTGFMAVNRDKLKALGAEVLAELAKTDELELIYLHLQSVRNFNLVRERLESTPGSDNPLSDTVDETDKAKEDTSEEAAQEEEKVAKAVGGRIKRTRAE